MKYHINKAQQIDMDRYLHDHLYYDLVRGLHRVAERMITPMGFECCHSSLFRKIDFILYAVESEMV